MAVLKVHDGTEFVPIPSGTLDADNVSYAPAVLGDWTGGADPGDADDALDQLADRLTWAVTGIKTTTYTASDRELVRVDPS